MADACVILQYFHLLVFPSVGCNRITRGSDQEEGRLKGRLSSSRASIIYQFFSEAERDVGLCTSVCSQFSASAQLQVERSSVRKTGKKEMANTVPEDKQERYGLQNRKLRPCHRNRRAFTSCAGTS